jgi:hypothetical protein
MTWHVTALSRNLSLAFGAAIAASVCASLPAAKSEPVMTTGQAQYQALQSISYEFGSKFTTGYFVHQAGKCVVTLMLAEKSNPEQPLAFTAARVRINLSPGQIVGLDSEEGRSLNFTCSEGASALLVDNGERDRLVALERNALPPVQEARLP